jgi:hypothetical protein
MVHKEFAFAYVSAAILVLVLVAAIVWRDPYAQSIEATAMIAFGGFLLAFGFWGADYAFSVKLGELDQSKQDGVVKGEEGKVYVPFVGNYTPAEWWNLNWFFVTIGAFSLAFGTFLLGITLGSLGA